MIDTEETLVRLVRYFDVMLTFKQHNFEVPTDLFLREFSDVCDLDTEEGLKDFLREEIAPADIVDDMTYMYSYLKAIELREKHNVTVLPISVESMSEYEIYEILKAALYEFPVLNIDIKLPEWVHILSNNHKVKIFNITE